MFISLPVHRSVDEMQSAGTRFPDDHSVSTRTIFDVYGSRVSSAPSRLSSLLTSLPLLPPMTSMVSSTQTTIIHYLLIEYKTNLRICRLSAFLNNNAYQLSIYNNSIKSGSCIKQVSQWNILILWMSLFKRDPANDWGPVAWTSFNCKWHLRIISRYALPHLERRVYELNAMQVDVFLLNSFVQCIQNDVQDDAMHDVKWLCHLNLSDVYAIMLKRMFCAYIVTSFYIVGNTVQMCWHSKMFY